MKKQSILSFVLALIVLFSSSTLASFADNGSTGNNVYEGEMSVDNGLVGAINPPAVSLDRTSVYIAPEQNLTLTAALIPAAAGSGITWSSSNTSVVTVSSAGTLNGVSPGTATVTASLNIYLGGYTCYAACTVTVTEIPNGTYFIKNKQNSDYVRIKNGTMSNNQNAVQYDFDGTNYERWIFTLNNTTGYYSIRSAVPASASVYLCVKSDSSALNEQIVIHSGAESTLTDGMKWKISTTSSGAYKLTPKTGENAGGTGVDYVLATGTSNGTNNTNLIQGKYVYNTSYRDEWYIFNVRSFVYESFSARILYDQTVPLSTFEINSIYSNATAAFITNFNLMFTRENILYSTLLDCDSSCCADSLDDFCTSECASCVNCNNLHHRSSSRLLDVLSNDNFYTYRLTGYALCRYNNNSHYGVVGLGYVDGNDAISSYRVSPDITCSIQHELSHNLGCSHDDCVSGQLCVLKGNLNYWCDTCRQHIMNNY